MEYLNSEECEDDAVIEEQFKRVMRASQKIMGRYAFRKLGEDGIRRPINKAIYDAWCRNLFFMKDEELLLLEKQGKKVYDSFLKLCNDPGFLQAIKSSDKKSFQIRFNYICDMLKEVLRGTKN